MDTDTIKMLNAAYGTESEIRMNEVYDKVIEIGENHYTITHRVVFIKGKYLAFYIIRVPLTSDTTYVAKLISGNMNIKAEFTEIYQDNQSYDLEPDMFERGLNACGVIEILDDVKSFVETLECYGCNIDNLPDFLKPTESKKIKY